ncbi:hypothetical protein RvY_17975 [Ramazzottius varieornatus]|uniref:Radial spoke head protein 3 homolog n=1 Tax=Ramazzottius varieornatus TaxID=947166 RepID=A0A1D1W443_RAMVA|nr:hypothetical protein RvY_17975 [Ramazzottius varieornatus]
MANYILRRNVPRYEAGATRNIYGTTYGSEDTLRISGPCPPINRQEKMYYGNLMTDPRVWRGNTYSMYRQQKLEVKKSVEEKHKKRELRARPSGDNEYHKRMRQTRDGALYENSGPKPVPGQQHSLVQTELFLQELSVKTPIASVANQTDDFLRRPPSPAFVQAKTGVDVETQIDENQLFLFDMEVMPLLECLNGKVIEQALLEILQEEELAAIRQQQRAYQTIKNYYRAEEQRLEEQQRRRRQEKEMRKLQRRELLKKEEQVAEKLATQAFAKAYMEALVPNVFMQLKQEGMFLSPARAELDIHMVPWVIGKVSEALDVETAINMVMMDLLKDALSDNVRNVLDPRHNSIADRAEDAASMASEVASFVIRTPTLEDLPTPPPIIVLPNPDNDDDAK